MTRVTEESYDLKNNNFTCKTIPSWIREYNQ